MSWHYSAWGCIGKTRDCQASSRGAEGACTSTGSSLASAVSTPGAIRLQCSEPQHFKLRKASGCSSNSTYASIFSVCSSYVYDSTHLCRPDYVSIWTHGNCYSPVQSLTVFPVCSSICNSTIHSDRSPDRSNSHDWVIAIILHRCYLRFQKHREVFVLFISSLVQDNQSFIILVSNLYGVA